MTNSNKPLLSVIVPIFNERKNLEKFHRLLIKTVEPITSGSYEIIYCDDGSTDQSEETLSQWHKADNRVKLIKLSRNFGKEYALSAGIAEATGRAILMLDGDGQHPIDLIPDFFKAWQDGVQVVIGIRTNSSGSRFMHLSSKLFYKTFNSMTNLKMLPGSTDFRLIDASVQTAFLSLSENNRITRGLIDWLGFKRQYIYFTALPRAEGKSGFNRRGRLHLAANSFVSLTPKPLYIFGYLGVTIAVLAFLLGVGVIIEQILLGDPLHWRFTGTAMLAILIIYLIGLVLISQAILSLYISHIQSQSQRRPLYIIDYKQSLGIQKP